MSSVHRRSQTYERMRYELQSQNAADCDVQYHHTRFLLNERNIVTISPLQNRKMLASSSRGTICCMAEAMVHALKERVEKFENHQHLHEIEGNAQMKDAGDASAE